MAPQRSWMSASWRTADGELEKPDQQVRTKFETEPKPASNNRIYVGNMPYTARRADIEALLQHEGYTVVNIDISIDPFTFRNPSYCFVDMLTLEDAQKALRSLSGKPFLGRPLKVKPCVQKHIGHSHRPSHKLIATRCNVISKENSTQLHDRSATDQTDTATFDQRYDNLRVYVGGLPKPTTNHVSDLEIRELFKDFNVKAVSKVKWPQEEHGRYSAYYAFVDMDSAEEARRAIATLDGTERRGGSIRVEPTRKAGITTQ